MSDDVYAQGLVLRDEATGLESVHICVGGPKIDRIQAAIDANFKATLERHCRRPEFSGEITIAILSEVTPETSALWRAMAEAEKRLKAAITAGKLQTAAGRPIKLHFEYTSADEK